MLDRRTSFRCLARTWLLGAAMTTRGMQHLGLLYAINPGLEALYGDPEQLAAARRRYLPHINTHPFMAPLFVGFLLALERQIAQGTIPAHGMETLSGTTATTLSALGDSFFSGTLLTFWALSASLMAVMGWVSLAAAWTLFLFALLLLFRVWTFFLGLRQGLMVLQRVRRMNLINWGDRLKLLNAVFLALLVDAVVVRGSATLWTQNFLWAMICCCCGVLVYKVHVPRLLLAAALCVVIYFFGIPEML